VVSGKNGNVNKVLSWEWVRIGMEMPSRECEGMGAVKVIPAHAHLSIKFRLAVLLFKYGKKTSPGYLARDLKWTYDYDSRRRSRSLWDDLPADVTSAPSFMLKNTSVLSVL